MKTRGVAGWLVVVFALGCSSLLNSQNPCPNTAPSDKAICLVPQIFGPAGMGGGGKLPTPLVDTGHLNHFESDFTSSFSPLNTAIGSQLTLLPFASPASGFTFAFAGGVPTRTSESLGPILAERAETIGKRKVFVGVSYQFFAFGTVDGLSLKDLPVVLRHVDTAPCNGQPSTSIMDCPAGQAGDGSHPNAQNGLSNVGCPFFPCGDTYEREFFLTETRIDLKVHQTTPVVTFGVTDRFDLSLAVPIVAVNMGVSSTARIIPNSVAPGDPNPNDYPHLFKTPDCPSATPLPAGCLSLTQTFVRTKDARGVGDVLIRAKGTLWKGERFRVAAASDFRLPTGDENNFLGSGTWGVNPFIIASYRARVSPHVNVGYQWNGDSILAGTINPNFGTATKGHLPNQLLYTVGADTGITSRFTFDLDLVGQRVFNGFRFSRGEYKPNLGSVITDPNVRFPNLNAPSKGDYNVKNLSAGIKAALVKRLVLTANVLYQLDNGGLRARVVPLGGLSYTF